MENLTESCIFNTLKQHRDATKQKIADLELSNTNAGILITDLQEELTETKNKLYKAELENVKFRNKEFELRHQIKMLKDINNQIDDENTHLLNKVCDLIRAEDPGYIAIREQFKSQHRDMIQLLRK